MFWCVATDSVLQLKLLLKLSSQFEFSLTYFESMVGLQYK
jgi:hypothetical protein